MRSKEFVRKNFQSFRFMGPILDKEVKSFTLIHNIKKN